MYSLTTKDEVGDGSSTGIFNFLVIYLSATTAATYTVYCKQNEKTKQIKTNKQKSKHEAQLTLYYNSKQTVTVSVNKRSQVNTGHG